MGDYNVKLSRLHHRVWQEELGVPATIDEYGWIQFSPTALGELSIVLREYSQEGMNLQCRIFEDFSDKAPPHQVLVQVCNTVNQIEDAKLYVTDGHSVVYASIYLVLAEPGQIPYEDLVRIVVLPAISRIKAVKDAFEEEMKKLS